MNQLLSGFYELTDRAHPDRQNTAAQHTASIVPSPSAIKLLAWSVNCFRSKVILAWTTTLETAILGFFLDRRNASSDPTSLDLSWETDRSLSGQGSTYQRNHYCYVDNDVQFEETYEYFLSNVDCPGKITTRAPVYIRVLKNSPVDWRINFRLG